MKKTKDYDNVFKTIKIKHKRLLIPVINEAFGTNYNPRDYVDVLPSEMYMTERERADGGKAIEEKISDLTIKLGAVRYAMECQSIDDDSIAVRMAEYTFMAANDHAECVAGSVTLKFPRYAVVYIKSTPITPDKIVINMEFPDGQTVVYESDTVKIDRFTKEYIIEKRLFAYIPFYIARYEKVLSASADDDEKNAAQIEEAVKDLEYFRDEMAKLHEAGELDDYEFKNLGEYVNTIIRHITDGNNKEERLVGIMGGTVITTEADKLVYKGFREGRQEGVKALASLVSDGTISAQRAADMLGMSVEDFTADAARIAAAEQTD